MPDLVIEPVNEANAGPAVRFLLGWVSDGEADARQHLADHSGDDGASLAAMRDHRVIGIVSDLWESDYAGSGIAAFPLCTSSR